MGQNCFVGATGVFQGISQDRHSVERPLIINRLGQSDNSARKPRNINGAGGEGIAE
jgi:hypothetical protein